MLEQTLRGGVEAVSLNFRSTVEVIRRLVGASSLRLASRAKSLKRAVYSYAGLSSRAGMVTADHLRALSCPSAIRRGV